MSARPRLVAIMGQTASGKSALAEALAARLDARLLNADAFQVYRGMDIGTGKPAERSRYGLLDLKDPDEEFGAGEWVVAALAELRAAHALGRDVVVVGGSGFYVRALLEQYADLRPPPPPELRASLVEREAAEGAPALAAELTARDPAAAARVDLRNPARVRRALERLLAPAAALTFSLPDFTVAKFGIRQERQVLDICIVRRLDSMLQYGWAREVESLRAEGYGPGDPGFRALGYSELWRAGLGETTPAQTRDSILAATRRYAKRQSTWLRREPRLSWLDAGDDREGMARRIIGVLD